MRRAHNKGGEGKKKKSLNTCDSLWCGPRFSTFYDTDVSTRLASFAGIVVSRKVTFHLSRIRECVSRGLWGSRSAIRE